VSFRCRHCKSDRIYAAVEFTGESWGRAVISAEKDGRPRLDRVRDYDEPEPEETGIYQCGDCQAEDELEALVEPGNGIRGEIPERLSPGDRVVLPDGLRAVVDEIEEDGEEFTVRGWHERFHRIEARLLEVV